VFGYFALVCAVTWSFYYLARGMPDTAARTIVFHLGVFTPGILALVLAAWARGGSGVAQLTSRLFRVDVPVRWFVFAVTYMAAAKLITAAVFRGLYGEWPAFGSEPWYLIAVATVFSTVAGGQAGEELGWRGYALPGLASRFGLRSAALIIGVVWAVWHLPLFFWFPEADTYGQSFPTYALGVMAISIAITWLYAHTNGSLFLTMLMHSAINQSVGIVSSAVPGATDVFAPSSSAIAWITVSVLWAFAAYALVRMPATSRALR
jgi:uncharacterized protein